MSGGRGSFIFLLSGKDSPTYLWLFDARFAYWFANG